MYIPDRFEIMGYIIASENKLAACRRALFWLSCLRAALPRKEQSDVNGLILHLMGVRNGLEIAMM